MAYEIMYTPILSAAAHFKAHEADQFPGDDNAYFKTPVLVTKGTKEFTALVSALTKVADAVGATKLKSGKYAPETLGLKVQKDEDGEPSNVYKYTPTSKKAPMGVDSDSTPMGRCDKIGLRVGEDSKVVLKVSCDKGTKGQVRSYVDAVQIVELKEYTAAGEGSTDTSGFGSIAGGYKAPKGGFADQTAGDGDAYDVEPEDDDGGLEI